MANKHAPINGASTPSEADNFKILKGIGPGIERRLHEAGILTYAQLAGLSPAEAAALVADVAGMTVERIISWGWVTQAKVLAQTRALEAERDPAEAFIAQTTESEPVYKPADESYAAIIDRSRQHLERFRLELLLDEDNNVRRTRVAHVQGSDDDTWDVAWAGWKDQQLLNFFAERAGLPRPQDASQVPLAPAIEPAPAVAESAEQELPPALLIDAPSAVVEASEATPAPTTPPRSAALPTPELAGTLRATALVCPSAGAPASGILSYQQPFHLQFTLDFSDIREPHDVPYTYAATIYTKNLRGGPRQIIGETQGTIVPAQNHSITMLGTTPPQGIYRLEAMIALTPVGTATTTPANLVAFVEGGLLQIY